METSNKEKKADKNKQPNVQDKPDNNRVKTVTPANENDNPDASTDNSSNKGQGPKGENL